MKIMELSLTAETSVADIQNQFSEEFPYLKLVIFLRGQEQTAVRKRKTAAGNTLLSSVSALPPKGVYSIDGSMTVAAFEMLLSRQLGINAQVYRRSGNMWIETNITDKWTLDHQNEQGRQLSIPLTEEFGTMLELKPEESAVNRDVAE